ncbi:unnamed protein product [Gemmata massiliana]|uniref:Lipoprotein n=1 Tax=Gemmata massiliana TaxID=1210884 RepID=A0A6P2CWC5_9BACT|nr:hypothetical protein [Gemmata massiliana]VTR93239.1 unnamed protein product [Gemmata massiliana]
MRCARLVLAVVVVSSTGCSALIASRGQDLSELTTKKVVHATFAKSVVRYGEGCPYDEFRTHRKISENWRCEYLAMAGVCTLGLAEFVNVPCELFRAV